MYGRVAHRCSPEIGRDGGWHRYILDQVTRNTTLDGKEKYSDWKSSSYDDKKRKNNLWDIEITQSYDYKSLLKESEKAYLFTWRSPVNCKRIFDLSWFLPAYMAYLIGSLLVKTDLVIR